MAVKVSYVRRVKLICNSRSNATKNTPVLPYLLFSMPKFLIHELFNSKK